MKIKLVKRIFAATCAAALLVGCGSGSMNSSAGTYEYAGAPAEAEYATEEMYDADYDEATQGANADTGGGAANDVSQKSKEAGTDENGKLSEQKLIYTADITIQTQTFQDTFNAVKDAITKVGGFVESESTSDSAWNWYYSDYRKSSGTLHSYITVRVPSAKYREFLSLIEGTDGKITSKSEYVQNITKRYNDQSILIESLEKQETRLLDMMDKAETIEDMITIESRLSEVQTQLNQARNTLAGYDTDIDYSTINVQIEEVLQYKSNVVQQTFLERLGNTFSRSWRDFGEFMQDLILAIVYLLPAILVIVIILVILRPFLKKWGAKRKEKREAKKAMMAERKLHQTAPRFPNPFQKKPEVKNPEAEEPADSTDKEN